LIVELLPAFDADELLYIFDEMKASCEPHWREIR